MDRYAPAALSLIDGDVEIPVRPLRPTGGDPVFCTSWDLGAPEVRITSTPRPSADGTDEAGGYLGARTVTLELRIRGDGAGVPDGRDPYWYVNQLTGMCHPGRRPVLKITRNAAGSAGTTWFMGLRGNPWSVVYDRAAAAIVNLTLTLTCPSGLIESDLHTVTAPTMNPADATDWHFPAAFPHNFGNITGTPYLTCNVGGTAPVYPILYVSGPAKNPKLRDQDGNRFEFSGLTLVAGQTVQIDMGAGTVLVADPDTGWTTKSPDVFHTVNFATSTFWQWQPGVHKVDLLGDGAAAVQWRDRQLSI